MKKKTEKNQLQSAGNKQRKYAHKIRMKNQEKATAKISEKDKRMIKCCMFDLDGTLLNTLSTITYYVNKTLQIFNILPISEDECKSFIGDGADKLIERSLKSRGEYTADFKRSVLEKYLALYDTDPFFLTKIYDGVFELVSELKNRGVICAVISNKQNTSTLLAIEHFFSGIFTAVRGGIAGLPLKPDPSSALQLLSELGVTPDEVMYIGDTAVDMHTGKNMGAALTVGVLWGFRDEAELRCSGADITVEKPCEILSQLK